MQDGKGYFTSFSSPCQNKWVNLYEDKTFLFDIVSCRNILAVNSDSFHVISKYSGFKSGTMLLEILQILPPRFKGLRIICSREALHLRTKKHSLMENGNDALSFLRSCRKKSNSNEGCFCSFTVILQTV